MNIGIIPFAIYIVVAIGMLFCWVCSEENSRGQTFFGTVSYILGAIAIVFIIAFFMGGLKGQL